MFSESFFGIFLAIMSAFENTREQTEKKAMVRLLTEIERNSSFTQRNLSEGLGIALGLTNRYLKRCISKGWVRISQVSPHRISYFLTPEGIKEKTKMVKDYVGRSLSFFRDAKSQCEVIFEECSARGWVKIALVGQGDLTEIAQLVGLSTNLELSSAEKSSDLQGFDAVLITDILDPQGTYDAIKNKVDKDRLLLMDLLHISRHKGDLS